VAQLINSAAGAHSWYPKECCSDNDCRPVPCAELTKINLGLMWRRSVIFDDTQTRDFVLHDSGQPGLCET
jgi:hypothetical protein